MRMFMSGRAHRTHHDHPPNLVGFEVAEWREPVRLIITVMDAHVQPARREPGRRMRRVVVRSRAEEQELLVRQVREAVEDKLWALLENKL